MEDDNNLIIFQCNDSCQIFDLDISIFQGKFNTLGYNKRDDFSFPISLFLDSDVPFLVPSYGVYIFSVR